MEARAAPMATFGPEPISRRAFILRPFIDEVNGLQPRTYHSRRWGELSSPNWVIGVGDFKTDSSHGHTHPPDLDAIVNLVPRSSDDFAAVRCSDLPLDSSRGVGYTESGSTVGSM
jgi:hypothetical protein